MTCDNLVSCIFFLIFFVHEPVSLISNKCRYNLVFSQVACAAIIGPLQRRTYLYEGEILYLMVFATVSPTVTCHNSEFSFVRSYVYRIFINNSPRSIYFQERYKSYLI